MNLLDTLIEKSKREDKKQGYRNIAEACDYLEKENIEINSGTVSRNLKSKQQKPSSGASIRNDSEGYMLYINTRREEQLSKQSRPEVNKPKDDIYSINYWMKLPHDQVCLALISTLIKENSLHNQLNTQKNLNRALEFDPNKFIGIDKSGDTRESQQKKITLDLIGDIKEAIRILSRIAIIEIDKPSVIIKDIDSFNDIGLFSTGEFLHAAECR